MTQPRNALQAALLMVGLTTPALAQKPVKIGVLTPLSPPGDAAAGQFIARGAKMGAEEVNARGGVLGGREIELVVGGDSRTPEEGAAGVLLPGDAGTGGGGVAGKPPSGGERGATGRPWGDRS